MSRGSYCIVKNCHNNKFDNPDTAFLHLPRDPVRAKEWMEFAMRKDLLNCDLNKNYRICSDHFTRNQFKKTYPRVILSAATAPNLIDGEQRLQQKENIVHCNITTAASGNSLQEGTDEDFQPPLSKKSKFDRVSYIQPVEEDIQTKSSPSRQREGSADHSKSSPRTKRKLNKYKMINNALRCKLFRKKKVPSCICGRTQKCRSSRSRLMQILKETESLLSKEAYTLFSMELKAAFINKYNRRYSDDMKQMCLNWYYSSPKGYKTFAKTINLLTPRTLRNWVKSINMSPGINKTVLEAIKSRSQNSQKTHEMLAVLLFDEISIKEELHYNSSLDKIIGVVDNGKHRTNENAKSVLVCMTRGITNNWRIVLGYWFLGGKETASNIYDIVVSSVKAATESGLDVRAIVSDQGPANQGLATKLGITTKETYFIDNKKKIYFIYDVPYLLKSVRNMLIKYDLQYKNEKVSWRHIKRTIELTHPIRLRLLPKVGLQHLNVDNFTAMKVKYAAQIFSDSMSVALLVLKHFNELESGAGATSDFVKDMDNLFDCLNSCKLQEDKIKMRYALTKDSPQIKFLQEMRDNLSKAVFIGAKKPACLKGWEITINSILQLAEDLRKCGVPKLLTRHLNQDPLENFFSSVRQQHGCCRNPNALQFENGLPHTLFKNVYKLSSNTNCENDNTIAFHTFRHLNDRSEHEPLKASEVNIKHIPELLDSVTLIDENAIYYVTAFVLKKFF